MATIAAQAQNSGAFSRDTPDAPEWRLLGCFDTDCPAEQIRSASPISYVNGAVPPMLLITGDKDTTVPYQQTLEFDEALTRAGVAHKLIVIPGINHSFIGTTHDETNRANSDALIATVRFIDEIIGNARSTGDPR